MRILVTLSARALHQTLHRGPCQQETEQKLKMAGANRVVSPYFISGRRMAAMVMRLITSDFLATVSGGGELEFRLHELPVPSHSSLVVIGTAGQSEVLARLMA